MHASASAICARGMTGRQADGAAAGAFTFLAESRAAALQLLDFAFGALAYAYTPGSLRFVVDSAPTLTLHASDARHEPCVFRHRRDRDDRLTDGLGLVEQHVVVSALVG